MAAEIIAVTVHGPNNLGEMSKEMTMSVATGILVGLCKITLEGADKLTEQLDSPELAWNRELLLEFGVRRSVRCS